MDTKQMNAEINWLKNELLKVKKTKHKAHILRQIKEIEYKILFEL